MIWSSYFISRLILHFLAKVVQKCYFQSNIEKVTINIDFNMFKLGEMSNINLEVQFWFLGSICSERALPLQSSENENKHRIQLIQIIISTNFQVKKVKLVFWTNFAPKGYFQPKKK